MLNLLMLGCLPLAQAQAGQEPEHIDFQREVRPILSDRCFSCHGPDEAAREADLRLDHRAGALADLGGYAAIAPGDLDESELIYRITAHDVDERMPPADSGLSLSESEVEVLRTWVAQGAEYTPHWSFVPPLRRTPKPGTRDWARDPLDLFVLERMQAAGLQPVAVAPDEVWLRRVSFVLTGLPPSAELLQQFPAQLSRAEVADQLLASPHYGEHMTAQWMDVARYADTYGYQNDRERAVWPYRDWVIQAYNDNLPYDDFLRWQLAGDLFDEPTRDQMIATAFQRLHRQTNEGGSVEEEFRVEYVSDRVHTTGMAFLGLTFECARCHDHKYDPITQREYYQMTDYFDDIDESGLYSHFTNATPTPAYGLPTAAQSIALADAESAVHAAEAALREASSVRRNLAELVPDEDESVRFDFDEWVEGASPGLGKEGTVAKPEGAHEIVAGRNGQGLRLSGDAGLRFSGVGHWRRSDPFTVGMALQLDTKIERSILLHRSKAWHDAASVGWQLLIEEGHLIAALVHFWPGDMIAIRSVDPLPVGAWFETSLSYDGSSRAAGMQLSIDGQVIEVEVMQDSLSRSITGGGPGDASFGARFRDKGFSQGVLDEVRFVSGWPGPADDPRIESARTALQDARRKRDELRDQIPQLMVMSEREQPRAARLLVRGAYDAPAVPVGRAVPAAFRRGAVGDPARGADAASPKDRFELANWMLTPDHPLTARVEVDRLWRSVFGKGLVRTPENWGSQGESPTHPKLLDNLALDFIASGWDRKAMLRRIVLSASFASDSELLAEGAAQLDPENQLWSSGPRRRLSAEMLRDAALVHSGLLVRTIGGPSVKPYQPAGLWKEKSGITYQPSTGEGLYRRSLYTFWKRTSPPPSMMIFDAAKRDVCVVRRQETNTPLQALVLWNDPQLIEASRVLAGRVLSEQQPLQAALRALYHELTVRKDEAPVQLLLELYLSELANFQADADASSALLAIGESVNPEGLDAAQHAAMTIVCSTLLSSELVVTLR
jgi:Protein of unknown function (DUF1553)/Protein of unknown function (DUF1549)/Planctomycete cytochrome C